MQCVRAYVYESKVFVSMVLILIFGEVLGLYGYVYRHACLGPIQDTDTNRKVDCCIDHEFKSNRGIRMFMIN